MRPLKNISNTESNNIVDTVLMSLILSDSKTDNEIINYVKNYMFNVENINYPFKFNNTNLNLDGVIKYFKKYFNDCLIEKESVQHKNYIPLIYICRDKSHYYDIVKSINKETKKYFYIVYDDMKENIDFIDEDEFKKHDIKMIIYKKIII